ncbi:MAG: sugar phosphate isomerase/epimerase family protein [Acutalibacteraceae bacterium]
MKNIAIQLYSVKDSLKNDFEGTLKALSDMGYDGVELCGGTYRENLKEQLEFYGLDPISSHIGFEELENNLDYHIEKLLNIGCKTIICPWTEPKTVEDAEITANKLLKISEKCIVKGIEFGYHNHAHEFAKPDGENTLFDIMMGICDPLVLTELDLGWVAKAGFDPEEYIRKYAGRVTYLHLKQFRPDGDDHKITTLENGIVDYEKCIKVGKLMGCEHFIVEQDCIEYGELEDAKKNIEFLNSLKV